MATEHKTMSPGEIAYNAYYKACPPSLTGGGFYTHFNQLPLEIQEAWERVGLVLLDVYEKAERRRVGGIKW